MNSLYGKLAFTNIKNNKQFYFPYLLMGILSAMMFYSMRAMQGNEGLSQMHGGVQLQMILALGTAVIAIFVCIFLFYTNSFIMKRRKKELGVYNILGMEKKHIAKVIFLEILFTFVISVGGGLLLGIIFNKLLMMFLYRLTGLVSSIQFYISWRGCIQTIELFGAIYLATFIYNFMQIQMSNPIELLRSKNTGEREPKTKIVMTLFGTVCIAVAYYISITTENPISVLMLFFLAVVLVMIGTYCLFTAGSIAFLKLLRKNKKYYYQTKHFTAVSGMIYRMKQNAVGLANICILSTMVLVMVSTTFSMYIGLGDELDSRYPQEITADFYYDTVPDEAAVEKISAAIKDCVKKSGRTITETKQVTNMDLTVALDENKISLKELQGNESFDSITLLEIMTKKTYENYANTSLADIADGEAAIVSMHPFPSDTVIFSGKEYRVTEKLSMSDEDQKYYNIVGDVLYLIVKDNETLGTIADDVKAVSGENGKNSEIAYQLGINIDGTPEEKTACAQSVRNVISEWQKDETLPEDMRVFSRYYVESRQEGYEDFLTSNGGLFFLGLFLGAMFLMVTVLIIYYKQISEGYDDKERFAIMEKVGMSNAEVKTAISAQVRIVFFLPLVTAAIHLAAAFPMLKRLLALLNLTNAVLFIWCLIGTVIVFGLIYLAVFILTSRSYYKIVGNQV